MSETTFAILSVLWSLGMYWLGYAHAAERARRERIPKQEEER